MLALFLAAQIRGAPGVIAHDGVGVVDNAVFVRALLARASCLTALFFLARVAVTRHLTGILDRSVTVRALDGVSAWLVGFVIWCGRRRLGAI